VLLSSINGSSFFSELIDQKEHLTSCHTNGSFAPEESIAIDEVDIEFHYQPDLFQK